MQKQEAVSFDLIWGAKEIGRVVGCTERQAFHMLEKRIIPARKIGSRWVAERNNLREFFLNDAVVKTEVDNLSSQER